MKRKTRMSLTGSKSKKLKFLASEDWICSSQSNYSFKQYIKNNSQPDGTMSEKSIPQISYLTGMTPTEILNILKKAKKQLKYALLLDNEYKFSKNEEFLDEEEIGRFGEEETFSTDSGYEELFPEEPTQDPSSTEW